MNVEIGTETPVFLFWEYLFQIFGILSLQCTYQTLYAGIIKLFPARESLVRDIPAVDGNVANLFLHFTSKRRQDDCSVPIGLIFYRERAS